MADYRRYYVPGGTYFFTVVTRGRRPILTTKLGRESLRRAIQQVRFVMPFQLFAIVLLPDHLHSVWILPPGDDDYSVRWKRIKHQFTTHWCAGGGTEAAVSPSQMQEGRRGIWQRRFWEHTIYDGNDLERCVDYLHWNPRKHGLVQQVCDWKWSSFHRFVKEGQYELTWGGKDPERQRSRKCDWGEPT